jgi:chromosome condensin MukBEF complex kleisin-like MukF subunit
MQFGGEAVRRHMHNLLAAENRVGHMCLHLLAVRPPIAVDDLAALLRVEQACRFRVQGRIADRAVQVDQQAADGGGEQRRMKRVGHLARQLQCAQVVASMRLEQRAIRFEQRSIRGRDAVAAMFASDDRVDSHGQR